MKKVFLTGGSKGIGEAAVRYFCLQKKYSVTFTYLSNKEKALHLVNELQNFDASVDCVYLNLNEPVETKSIINNLVEEKNGFDIVIHNAAQNKDVPLYFMSEQEWGDVINSCLNSFYYINKACLKNMIENRFGKIISLVSISGEAGNRGQTNYSAAKGAIISASKALAREVAGKGITVNCVSPGLIETNMTAHLPKEELKKLIPMARMGKPEEVAGVIAFLASDEASYITGEVIRVNGGLYT